MYWTFVASPNANVAMEIFLRMHVPQKSFRFATFPKEQANILLGDVCWNSCRAQHERCFWLNLRAQTQDSRY